MDEFNQFINDFEKAVYKNDGMWYEYFDDSYKNLLNYYLKQENKDDKIEFMIGVIYYHGFGSQKLYGLYGKDRNVSEAIKWFLKAVKKENKYAAFYLGSFYCDLKQYKEAEDWFKKAQDFGYEDIEYYLGFVNEKMENFELALMFYSMGKKKFCNDIRIKRTKMSSILKQYE